ncbi:hypothetical protein [Brevibacillus sp. FIR094]|uniref:hypothetical protein n=1 Tax=Brevibacillus sp. FIR094 TaxID=3134809 RepID=UPI003D1C3B6A
MTARQYAAGANKGVYVEKEGNKIYSVQSHSIEENSSVRLVHEYGNKEAVGQTDGSRTHSISIESAIAMEYTDDTMPLYILLREPGTEITRYIGEWKTVFTGLMFNNYRETGNLESQNESISLTATKRQDFFKGKPISFDKARNALGR